MAPSLLEIAEAPAAYVAARPSSVVEGDGFVFLPLQPTMAAAQRIRLAPERLEAARAEIRDLAAQHGVASVGWFRSELSTPHDFPHRLGLDLAETLSVLALTRPPAVEPGHEIREVTTLEDYATSQQIDAEANGWPRAEPERIAQGWEVARKTFVTLLAFDEGRPVGMGRCVVAANAFVMIGGSVLPDARGRGVYRSLVAARWTAARERGLDALVTTANDQSGPILERLAFERLGEIEVWSDRL